MPAPPPSSSSSSSTPPSLFDLHSRPRKRAILAGAAFISILTPFTDTVYLPALGNVAATLTGADDAHALSATVSVYMVCVGVFSLVWGPMSDYFGRKWPIFLSLVLFLAFTGGCAVASDVFTLIGLRAAQGAVVGCTVSATQGVVADVFAPAERGWAMGWFLIPLLVGPIAAPIVGGALSAAAGWRSTFYLLLGLAGLLLVISAWLPETHHFHVVQGRIKKEREEDVDVNPQSSNRENIVEGPAPTDYSTSSTTPPSPSITTPPPTPSPSSDTDPAVATSSTQMYRATDIKEHPVAPVLVLPWKPLAYLVEWDLAPYVAVGAANFSSMFVALTNLFPNCPRCRSVFSF
jgi:MFS family permease